MWLWYLFVLCTLGGHRSLRLHNWQRHQPRNSISTLPHNSAWNHSASSRYHPVDSSWNVFLSPRAGHSSTGASTAPSITISGMPNQPRPIIDGRLLPFGGAHASLLAICERASTISTQRALSWALAYAASADVSENEMTGCGVNGLRMGTGTSVAIHDNWIHHNDVSNQYRKRSNWDRVYCLGCVLERNLYSLELWGM